MLPRRATAVCAALSVALVPVASAKTFGVVPPKPDTSRAYERIVAKVANMIGDERAYSAVSAHGLQLLNVMWEDTGRWLGSSVGPNISDVTIEVEAKVGKQKRTYLMPVMRYDNFTDKTADVRMNKIMIPVGNQTEDGRLHLVSLEELLKSPEQYMSTRDKGKIKRGSLWAKRDTHALVSAQHAFLPVPKEGQATFYPVIFNYQSSQKNPAVLTILVTRQGTSITIVDNARDTVGGSWGQRLYFNKGGKRAPLIAERLADVKASGTTANGESAQDLKDDANVLMLIQVPLKYREPRYDFSFGYGALGDASGVMAAPKAASGGGAGGLAESSRGRDRSDIDTAVLGHGPTEGPYTELDGLTVTRDTRFPVRVTLQFYQATSNGVVSRANVKDMAAQIKKVYAKGDYVGSLVVPSGVDRRRPTNWAGVTHAIDASWQFFPGLVERLGTQYLWPSVGIM